MGLLFAFDFMFGELYILGFGLGHLFCFHTSVCIHSFVAFVLSLPRVAGKQHTRHICYLRWKNTCHTIIGLRAGK